MAGPSATAHLRAMNASNAPPAAATIWTPRRVVGATLIVAAIAAAFYLTFAFRLVLACLLLGIVIDTALTPLFSWATRLGIGRSASIVLVYLVLGLAAVVAIAVAVPRLVDQAASLGERLPQAYAEVREQLAGIPNSVSQRLVAWTPDELPPLDSEAGVFAELRRSLFASRGLGEAIILASFWAGAVLLLAFNWSLQKDRSIGALSMLISESKRGAARELVAAFFERVGAFVRGQAVLCFSVAGISLVAFWLIGLPHALALAALAGLFELVPYVGPILAAFPPLLVALAFDPSLVVWVLAAAVAVQVLENNLLVPAIMDRAVGVHPVVSLLALVAFTDLFGALGMILAVPLSAMVQVVCERWLFNTESTAAAAPVRRDETGRALWELRALIQDVRSRLRAKDDAPNNDADLIEDRIEAIAADLERQLAAEDGDEPHHRRESASGLEAVR